MTLHPDTSISIDHERTFSSVDTGPHQKRALELDPMRIDLWFAFFDEIREERLLHQYRQLLSEEERQQTQRFHFPQDQHRYLVTRALVRTTLSRYAPIAPDQWSFSKNAYGRPEIENDDDAARKISFNLSHTPNLIVLGITNEVALGLDTENPRVRQSFPDVAEGFFSRKEVAALRTLPINQQHQRFFDYWTLKESYIKARGMGLSIPLDQFSFHFTSPHKLAISIDPRLNDEASRWMFWQLQVSLDYLVAICVEQLKDRKQQLKMHKVVPLQSDEALYGILLRDSEIRLKK